MFSVVIVCLLTVEGSFVTITHNVMALTLQTLQPRPPSRLDISLYRDPPTPDPLWTWHFTVQRTLHLLVSSGGHHWKPVSTSGPPKQHWHLVAIEAGTVGPRWRYASYWNVFFCFIIILHQENNVFDMMAMFCGVFRFSQLKGRHILLFFLYHRHLFSNLIYSLIYC